jgi:xanthine dehydrogenase accessory factor
MNELAEIIAAFDELCRDEKPAALALVIGVDGSAYRRPGARMLIAEDGRTWGGVSGGCLERDVARRARGVIVTGQCVICRYDSSDDEEMSNGAATGCGGAVEILIQPISMRSPGPMLVLKDAVENRREVKLATVIRRGDSDLRIGDHMEIQAGRSRPGFLGDPDVNVRLVEDEALPASASEFFVETISPPQALVIFGSGPDAVPLCAIAKTLGWHVTIVASRPATFAARRFALADAIAVTSTDDPLAGVEIQSHSAVVVMTHNLARDQRILSLLPASLRYVGLLGPRLRAERIMRNVSREVDEIFAPVGLDLGAQTPQEIALAIAAEILSAIRQASGGSLRDQCGPIHPRAVELAACGLAPLAPMR